MYRSRHAPSTGDQRTFLDLSLGPLLDGLEWFIRQELDGSSGGSVGGASSTASSEVSHASLNSSSCPLQSTRLDLRTLLSLTSSNGLASGWGRGVMGKNGGMKAAAAGGVFSSEARAKAVCACLNAIR